MMASFNLILLLVISTAVALLPESLAVIDVPRLLPDKSQYSMFLKLLTQTKVVDDVSKLKTATVLVVPDKAVRPLLSLSPEKQRIVLQNHVLLKYLDPVRLGEMKVRTAMLETLLSLTDKRLGVVNYTEAGDEQMYLRAPGEETAAKIVKVVAARPSVVSVMEVSEPIMCLDHARDAGRRGKGFKMAAASDGDSGGAAPAEAPGSESSGGGAAPPAEAPSPSPSSS